MCEEEAAGGRRRQEERTGVHDQKQEPHTQMWGITVGRYVSRRKGVSRVDSPTRIHGKTQQTCQRVDASMFHAILKEVSPY